MKEVNTTEEFLKSLKLEKAIAECLQLKAKLWFEAIEKIEKVIYENQNRVCK